MKKVVCLSVLCFFVFGLAGSLPAMDACCAADVGNKICPVTGDKIDEKTKATYEYKGRVYNFCCPGCIDEFKKNPEKYIKKIEAEKKKEDSMHEDSEHQHMH